MSYNDLYQQSLNDPDAFWGEAAQAIHWDKPWDKTKVGRRRGILLAALMIKHLGV